MAAIPWRGKIAKVTSAVCFSKLCHHITSDSISAYECHEKKKKKKNTYCYNSFKKKVLIHDLNLLLITRVYTVN